MEELKDLAAATEGARSLLGGTSSSMPDWRSKKDGQLYYPSQVVVDVTEQRLLVVYRMRGELKELVFFARPLDEWLEQFELVEDVDG